MYTSVTVRGPRELPKAWKCSEIVEAIEYYRQRKIPHHRILGKQELVCAIGKDLIKMGLISVGGENEEK